MSTVQSPAGPDARLDVDLLAGVRVVELGAFVAVPFAGHLMARLGARVTRAEPSNVDPAHRLPGGARPSLYDYLNGDKAIRPLPADRRDWPAALAELAADADVVIADARDLPAGFTADHLPVCVLRVVPGDQPAPSDSLLLSALSGVSWAVGEPDRPPLAMPAHTADFLAGLVFAGSVLAAYLGGARGRRETSGLAALSAYVEQNSTSYRSSGIGWRREGRRAPACAGIYPYGVHDCRDGQIVLIGRSTRDWREIAGGVGAEGVLDRFPDPFAIAREHADEVDALLAPYLAKLDRSDVMTLAEQHGILAAPVVTPAEALRYDHLATERGFWDSVDGRRVPGLPFLVESPT